MNRKLFPEPHWLQLKLCVLAQDVFDNNAFREYLGLSERTHLKPYTILRFGMLRLLWTDFRKLQNMFRCACDSAGVAYF